METDCLRMTEDRMVTRLELGTTLGSVMASPRVMAHCPTLLSYQLKPCLLEGVYFSSRAVNFRSEYFCSRFIWATD